jgi:hypothetical protein
MQSVPLIDMWRFKIGVTRCEHKLQVAPMKPECHFDVMEMVAMEKPFPSRRHYRPEHFSSTRKPGDRWAIAGPVLQPLQNLATAAGNADFEDGALV